MCDVKGCHKFPYAEVFPNKFKEYELNTNSVDLMLSQARPKSHRLEFLPNGRVILRMYFGLAKGDWSYLCKRHYEEEYLKHGDQFAWYVLNQRERIRATIEEIIRLSTKYLIWGYKWFQK